MNASQLKDLDRLIDEIKECAHGLVNEIAREQMEVALAHLRQAWRAEKYNDQESVERTAKTMAGWTRLNRALAARRAS